jgi:hypothetical protein
MPRYFFNIVVRGRKAIPDPDDDVLTGDKEAREQGRMVAREMPGRRHLYKPSLEHWTFEITTGNGRKVGAVRSRNGISTGSRQTLPGHPLGLISQLPFPAWPVTAGWKGGPCRMQSKFEYGRHASSR